ncbi:uncharacterized protein A1O5_05525 [Cladophialophora psammophila CBS 110553]|uniref:Xylanolytic transcriptional activator regulatory domain-containing protein n=1 Tax=Cladophialophora psammophila CBS 110553 TaxID=1182543 RepID=W9WU32_9EURO|nr:uncharacterized protein A1O5_05525 [Cladophialophora psammophila CBS 110553]EXJ71717.1 hypothetical protein A1O5_05525 [Cladophialophora psammophila CBS 110553]
MVEGTENHRDLLTGLLRSIRSSDENDAQHLFRLIRNDAPLSTINAFIDDSVRKLRENSPKTDATVDGLLKLRAEAASLGEQTSLARTRRKTMSVEQMTDEPLFQLTARPWTTVTDDDSLVSHLVSLYFTWWNTFMHPLHEPFLIEAMAAGDTMSPLCSSFLVNALLALSCSYSDLPGAFADPDDPDTWGEHFYDEARRLWDREEGRTSMTNLQGLYLLMLYQNMRGKDQLGWSTMSQVIHMYQELGLCSQIKLPRDCPAESVDKMKTAMLNVSWSVFTCNTIFAIFLLKPPTLRPPTVARPFTGEDLLRSVEWKPYPRAERTEPLYGESLVNAYCDLAEIAYEVALSVPFTEHADRNVPLQLMVRLRDWHGNLPAALQASPEAPGPLFELHAIYYSCALTLSEVSDRQTSPATSPAPAALDMLPTVGMTARSTSLLLIHQMLPLYRQFRQTYGLIRVMAGSCQTAAVAYFILLKALRDPSGQSEENEEALIDLTMHLMMGARRWLVYAGMLRMLRPTAQLMGVKLPRRLNEILDEFDKTVWTAGAHKRIRSVYPNLALVKKDAADGEDITMGELLARWEAVLMDDQMENHEDD